MKIILLIPKKFGKITQVELKIKKLYYVRIVIDLPQKEKLIGGEVVLSAGEIKLGFNYFCINKMHI